MLTVSGILLQLVGDVLRWWALTFRSSRSIKAENLFLRRQLGLYIERGVRPRRIDSITRISLTLLSRFFDWRDDYGCGAPRDADRRGRALERASHIKSFSVTGCAALKHSIYRSSGGE
jgi:hypothetical protein